MVILDTSIKDKCFMCKTEHIIHKMFIFDKQLYCFKCSMDRLKHDTIKSHLI